MAKVDVGDPKNYEPKTALMIVSYLNDLAKNTKTANEFLLATGYYCNKLMSQVIEPNFPKRRGK